MITYYLRTIVIHIVYMPVCTAVSCVLMSCDTIANDTFHHGRLPLIQNNLLHSNHFHCNIT